MQRRHHDRKNPNFAGENEKELPHPDRPTLNKDLERKKRKFNLYGDGESDFDEPSENLPGDADDDENNNGDEGEKTLRKNQNLTKPQKISPKTSELESGNL